MAEDLGEVRVKIEQEGAQEAADTIGDAAGEAGTGQEQGGGGGGAVGGLLGGISAKLAGILGFVAFLATLKPIQELLSGLQRLFSVAILPLVALLNAFLRPILQKLLRFIGELDFDNLTQELLGALSGVLNDFADAIVTSFKDAVFGTDEASEQQEQFSSSVAEGGIIGLSNIAGGGLGQTLGPRIADELTSADREEVFERARQTGRGLEIAARNPTPIGGIVDFISEQSPSVFGEKTSETISEQTQRNTAGSE